MNETVNDFTRDNSEFDSGPVDGIPKTFTLRISNGILDHYPRMGEAIWLFLWCIDKTTREYPGSNGAKYGIVLGGRAVPDKEIAGKFDCSVKTVRRWRTLLATEGYIHTEQTGHGCSYKVLNSKKWPRRQFHAAIRTMQARTAAIR